MFQLALLIGFYTTVAKFRNGQKKRSSKSLKNLITNPTYLQATLLRKSRLYLQPSFRNLRQKKATGINHLSAFRKELMNFSNSPFILNLLHLAKPTELNL